MAALCTSGLLLSGFTRCTASSEASLDSPLLRERFLDGRLAHQTEWAPCAVVDTTALVARARCTTRRDSSHEQPLAIRTALRGRSDSSSTSLRLTAVLDLRWNDGARAGIDRGITALEEATRRAPNDAAAFNDLAVAHLARAERDQQLRPLLQALEAVEHARLLDPASLPSLFNRALILQRLNLLESARRAWQEYLDVERSPAWRNEAHQQVRRIETFVRTGLGATPPAETLLAPDAGQLRSQLRSLAQRTPQWARETGFALLGAWGTAVGREDSSRAQLALSTARELARALEQDSRDRSLPLALATIDASRSSAAAARDLARAHAAYAAGYALYTRGAYEEAADRLERAERIFRARRDPAAGWAAAYRAVALVNQGHYAAGDQILERVISNATEAEPALVGKAIWVRGLGRVRQGAYEVAGRDYREAMPFFVRAGETENVGMLASLLAEALELAGQTAAGQMETLRGLSFLAPYRRSGFLSNQLGLVADQARREGLHRAVLAVLGEVLQTDTGSTRPQIVAWARGERARTFVEIGAHDSARAEIARAIQWLSRIDVGAGREQFGAAIALANARLLRATDPRSVPDELMRVVAAYRGSNNEIELPNALHQAAMAARDAGDTAAAHRFLDEAVSIIERRQTLFPSAEVRASFYETMEVVFDALIALEMDAGRPASAFRYLERARAAAWASHGDAALAPSIGDVQRTLPANAVLLEYAVLTDRVIVWIITRGEWRHQAIDVERDSVASLVARFDAEAARPVIPGGGARARLYDLLVRPAAREVAMASALAIVPDRELSAVPFAAFWNRSTSQYLVETAAVRTLPSAAFVIASRLPARPGVRQRAVTRALVVGDPQFDSVAVPHIGRLPGAAREAARVADVYPDHRLLTGPLAGREAIFALLRTASVFHFAGHAISNMEQPELSYLALSPDAPGSDGLLRAREIARLRLSNLSMVILSGCSTLGTRATHVGPLAGLAYSFVRAQAPAIISSLWDVDDEATTPLLVAFHRHLAAGESAAEALRSSQREALGSQQAAFRAPRVWAAFVYTGP